MKEKLAIYGGRPTLNKPLPVTNTIGQEEIKATLRVLKSGVLSDFVGRAGNHFLGGREVKKLEQAFVKKFAVRYAVSFNSATTALEAAVAALELAPGSEVIVSPYTMSATATAIMVNNLVPVFADIDPRSFCLDSKSIAAGITKRTKAIIVTNLFGGPANYAEIMKLARRHHLKVIEDNAQAPGGRYHSRALGTIGDIGVFSFNFHKVIHAGEGGVLVTNNKKYAFGAQLKRNHGENVLDDLKRSDPCIVGSNFRMTEIHAAIAYEQLKKLDRLTAARITLANYLSHKLSAINGLTPCEVKPGDCHVFYVYPILFDAKQFGLSRSLLVKAMAKEGFVVGAGYQKPLYLFKIFHSDRAFRQLPFLKKSYYQKGRCPVAEQCFNERLLITTICRFPLTKKHVDMFIAAIKKIQRHRAELL